LSVSKKIETEREREREDMCVCVRDWGFLVFQPNSEDVGKYRSSERERKDE